MGCDIHMMKEYRFDPFPDKTEWKHAWWVNGGAVSSMILVRDYALFAVLANVRNRGGIVPIDQPRGVSLDACSEFQAWQESWGDDAHSSSYLTLAELKAYPHQRDAFRINHVVHDGAWRDLLKEIEKLPGTSDDDKRISFFFDN